MHKRFLTPGFFAGLPSRMRSLRSLFVIRLKVSLQYRAAALAGIATQTFWGFIMIFILEAFYASSTASAPMDFPQVVTYIWLGQAFLGMLPWNIDLHLASEIRSGNIGYSLVKPLGLYSQWFVSTLGDKLGRVLLRALPLLFFVTVILPLTPLSRLALIWPRDFMVLSSWLMSLILALVLGVSFLTSAHATMLWTISADGIRFFIMPVVTIFSGMIIPLPLFPDVLQTLLRLLPFSGMVDVPNRIYSGDISGPETALALTIQLVWIVLFMAAGRFMMSRGTAKLVVQGG